MSVTITTVVPPSPYELLSKGQLVTSDVPTNIIGGQITVPGSTTALPVGVSGIYVQDNFIGSNGTALGSHFPDIGTTTWGFTAATSFYLQNGTLAANRQTDGDQATYDTGSASYTLTADVTQFQTTTGTFGFMSVMWWWQDANNFFYLNPRPYQGDIAIYQVIGGITSQKASIQGQAQIAGGAASKTNVRLDVRGQFVDIWINGNYLFNYTFKKSLPYKMPTTVGFRVGIGGIPPGRPYADSLLVQQYQGNKINWPVWRKFGSNPIVTYSSTTWEATDVNDPSLGWDPIGNQWIMAYTADNGTNASAPQQVGLATISGRNILGSYTKSGLNPVFASTSADGNNGMNGGLVYWNGLWHYYFGQLNGTTLIAHATSVDTSTWTRQGTVVLPGASGTWCSSGVFDAFARVRQDNSAIDLWCAGSGTGGVRGIGRWTSVDGHTFIADTTNPYLQAWNATTQTGLPWCDSSAMGEPSVFVPNGKENQEMMISFDSALQNNAGRRFISHAVTLNQGSTWSYNYQALESEGTTSAWESSAVFDSHCVQSWDNQLVVAYAGSVSTGTSLHMSISIGLASADWPYTTFKGQ